MENKVNILDVVYLSSVFKSLILSKKIDFWNLEFGVQKFRGIGSCPVLTIQVSADQLFDEMNEK